MTSAAELVQLLGLAPHPEGGYYKETLREQHGEGRATATAIYFLLEKGQVSHWHRVDAVELWIYNAGSLHYLFVITKAVLMGIVKGHRCN